MIPKRATIKGWFKNTLLIFGLSGVIVACVTLPPPPTTIIPSTTKVLAAPTLAALETVQPTSLTFAGTQAIAINDVVVTGKPEQILSAIDPNTVESVEVKTGINVLYGSLGGNGIVAIYTRKDIGNQESKIINSPTMMNVIGYSRPRKFNHVNYSGTSPFEMDSKCKSTIYWNPIVKTDAIKGTATISFYASDVAGKYRLVAEGVTEKGEPIRCVYIIEISNE